MKETFYSETELKELGIKKYGHDVKISRNAILYSPGELVIGSHVRIDDFTVISGKVTLHNNIHISQFCGLYGGRMGIEMDDFSGLSSKCSVYAVSDDYSGSSMSNPTVPMEYKPKLINAAVRIGRHAVIGCNSVVLPGVEIADGSSVGSMSLCTRNTEPWTINTGIPARKKGIRKKDILQLEKQYMEDMGNE